MTVTVGTDVYLAVAEADAYHAARSASAWDGADTAEKEAALLRATAHLDGRYRWVGLLAELTQPLGWPRIGAYDLEGRLLTGIPERVRHATAELALIALSRPLSPSSLERGGRIASERVGPVELRYAANAPVEPVFPVIDQLLRGLVRGSAATGVHRL